MNNQQPENITEAETSTGSGLESTALLCRGYSSPLEAMLNEPKKGDSMELEDGKVKVRRVLNDGSVSFHRIHYKNKHKSYSRTEKSYLWRHTLTFLWRLDGGKRKATYNLA